MQRDSDVAVTGGSFSVTAPGNAVFIHLSMPRIFERAANMYLFGDIGARAFAATMRVARVTRLRA
jgi:hypothetical protein